jgi:hypothetical protein
LLSQEEENMVSTGIRHLDALARAEEALGAYRRWTQEQAMARDAGPEAVEEYLRATEELLALDQRYWRLLAQENAAAVAARRGPLSPEEKETVIRRTLAGFEARHTQYQERVRPLRAQLPEVLQAMADAERRRDWLLSWEAALAQYAHAVRDTLDVLREGREPWSPTRKEPTAAQGATRCR